MRFLKRFKYTVQLNRVIEFLTLSDILMLSGWGLVSPILAIFIADQVIGGNVATAGLATTIYLLVYSIFQLPVAEWIDKHKGEWDDFWFMVVGASLITVSAFMYIWVRYPWEVFLVETIHGLGGALSTPAWSAIFTRHIDKNHEGMEWTMYNMTTGLGAALTAGLGGFFAEQFGYGNLFLIVGISSLFGTIFLAGVTHDLKKRLGRPPKGK
jgi:MFS family permease